MRRLLDLAYRVQKRLWKLLRPRTRGVKVMLFDAGGGILLIRNSYGASEQWVLPGGGIRPWETPEKAAVREVREELGCDVRGLALVGAFASTGEGKRDTISLFEAVATGTPTPDNWEVEEARTFALTKLPPTVSPATRRRIEERLGQRQGSGTW